MKKILIVDDNKDFTELLKIALSKEYSVVVASNTIEALKYFKAERFDVLLSDFHIGENSAQAFLDDLNDQEDLTNLVIIVMSGSGEMGTTEFSIPINQFIAKPFSMKNLRSLIEEEITQMDHS